MLKQHVHAAMRRIAANGRLGDFFPLAFAGQVHGVHNVRWPGRKAPRKAVSGHRELGVDVVAVMVGAEAVSMGGVIVRNRGQGAELYFAVGAGAFALDEQDEAVKLVLDIFRLGEMQRFTRSAANDVDRPRPVTRQKRKLAHGLALHFHAVRGGLLCSKRETDRDECCCEQRCGKKWRKIEVGECGFHWRTPWRRGAILTVLEYSIS